MRERHGDDGCVVEAELLDDVMDVGRCSVEEGKLPEEQRAMVDFFRSIVGGRYKRTAIVTGAKVT